jgi:YVTN family beta-propeller protein
MRKAVSLVSALCALILFPAVNAYAEHHTLIVLSQDDRSVYDMDPATGKVLGKIQFEGVPTDAVYSWDEQSLFVAVPDAGYVAVIKLPSFQEASRVTRPEFKRSANAAGMLGALATTPDYKKLYVSVPGGLEVFDQQLLVFSPEYKQPVKKIALPGQDGKHMLVYGPANKLYYAFQRDNQVAVVDTLTDKVVKMIPVKGGPTDVTFFFGAEAWVTAADGSVSIIDTNKDEVVKTIQTGGKGPGRITLAHDQRYIAVSHDDSGDVTILQPMAKEVAGTVKIGKGPLSVAFAPAGYGPPPGYRDGEHNTYKYPPTNQLYIAGQSTVSTVDLDTMAVTTHQTVGQNLSEVLIHYTYPNSFGDGTPRDETESRLMDNDTFIYYDNAMPANDLAPIHEHREDMVGIHIGQGTAKVGCWETTCPPDGSDANRPPNQYTYSMARVGDFTAEPHGELHEEEGASASPRRMAIFMMKNNYYRWINPKTKSDFEGQPGFALNINMARAWLWNLTLDPGKPVHFPKTDYAILYLGGGLIKETHNGVPTIVHRLFSEPEYDPTEKTIEAVGTYGNRVRVVVVEFK